MADIFSRKHDHKTGMGEDRISIRRIKEMIGKKGSDTLLTSFAVFPTKTCFETQNDDEEVVVFLRQHPIVMLPWIVITVFLLTLPSVFVFFPFYSALPATYQLVLTLGWYLFVFGYALAKLMGWFFNIYIITDERIVDVDFINIFFRKISTAKIEQIQDVNVSASGAFETFFGYGSVRIQTAAEVPEFDFLYIPKPDQIGKILSQMIDQEEQEKIEGRTK